MGNPKSETHMLRYYPVQNKCLWMGVGSNPDLRAGRSANNTVKCGRAKNGYQISKLSIENHLEERARGVK
jgi:Teichoic acid biosynthesis proteins